MGPAGQNRETATKAAPPSRGSGWVAGAVVAVLAAGAGGYALGANSGADLDLARREGTRVGLRKGREAGITRSYEQAYARAYRRTLRGK